jgi:formylglycine-generating enzyme required for sulfatase activity
MKNLLTFFLCFTIAQAYTQSIVNVTFRQEGETVRITYDIKNAQDGQTFNIELYCSTDGGRTYGNALKAVSGDVGEKIIGGYSKTIIWKPMQENITTLESDKVKFKVTAIIKSTMPDNMVFVKGGTFQMGSEDGEDNEKPIHSVTVSDFYIGKYEVTVAEFKKFITATGYKTDAEKEGNSIIYTTKWEVMKGVYWKHDTKGDLRRRSDYNHPVIHVSWNDATAYCKWLQETTGKGYRLPTEAEWEYAARGGNQSKNYKYAGTNDESSLYRYANFADKNTDFSWSVKSQNDNYAYTAPVGKYLSNELGIYDMSGNVWEWCSDWYGSDYYKNSSSNNPKGANSGAYRVLRGGAWINLPAYCRIAFLDRSTPTSRYNNFGFRVVFP